MSTVKTYNVDSGDATNLTLKTNGTTAVTVDSSQNVGIGTTSPAGKLEVSSATLGEIRSTVTSSAGNVALFRLKSPVSNYGWYTSDNTNICALYDYNAGAERMRIDSSGNLGIGTTSPSQKLTVAGAGTAARLEVINTSDVSRGGYLRDTGSTFELGTNSGVRPLAFAYDGSEKMRIDTSGNLLVGTTSVINSSNAIGQFLNVNGGRPGIAIGNSVGSSATNAIIFINSNGTVGSIQTSASATSYVTSSDYRLKENITPMTGALTKVSALKPVTYKWKVDGSDGQGFIAHELSEVIPQCVVGEKDAVDADGNPVYQGIDTSFLVATLTAAIQEQQAIIEQLKADVAALKVKV